MTQHYSNPKRESDPHTLPDVETFYHQHAKRERMALNAGHKAELYGECITDDEGDCLGTGWYWQSCTPGCLPDGEPNGPFDTEEEALADAQAGNEPDDEPDDNRRGRFAEKGDEGYEGLFRALDRAIELTCEEATRSAISDTYRHLIGDCIPEGCELCADAELPQCVLSMGCYCAGHARGNAASEPCDTSEVGS